MSIDVLTPRKLSGSEISTLTGISLPALSAYWSGARAASADTARRIAVAAAVPSDSVLLTRGLTTFPAAGAIVKAEMGTDPRWCLRVLAQAFQQCGDHDLSEDELKAFHNAPVHIPHPGWRTLVTGVVMMSWSRYFPGRPWWAQPVVLPEPWSPTGESKYLSQVWLKTPILLRQMNVVVGDGIVKAL